MGQCEREACVSRPRRAAPSSAVFEGDSGLGDERTPAPKAPKFFEFFRKMLTRVITLRFNGVLDGFDDAPLRDFIKDKEVYAARLESRAQQA
jgi:hypothetical protein